MPVSCEFCQVEVSATGWLLVQRSRTECDSEASIMRRPWHTARLLRRGKKNFKLCTSRTTLKIAYNNCTVLHAQNATAFQPSVFF